MQAKNVHRCRVTEPETVINEASSSSVNVMEKSLGLCNDQKPNMLDCNATDSVTSRREASSQTHMAVTHDASKGHANVVIPLGVSPYAVKHCHNMSSGVPSSLRSVIENIANSYCIAMSSSNGCAARSAAYVPLEQILRGLISFV